MSKREFDPPRKIQLVIPMSGQGARFRAAGFEEPKPLVPVRGRPMIERLLDAFPADWPTTFVLAENHRSTRLPAVLAALRPEGKQLHVPVHREGPGRALAAALDHLDPALPVLVSYCDYGMPFSGDDFARYVADTGCDAALVSYRGFHPHYLGPTTYAYSRLEGERVVDVREKESFTGDREREFASAGAYYFRSVARLRDALAHQERRGLRVNGELYTSLTVKALLELDRDADVRVYEIPYFFQWGTPEDVRAYEFWEETFARKPPADQRPGAVSQIVLPMAGEGSRFRGLTNLPKPLLPALGLPLWERALASLPAAERIYVAALRPVAELLATRPELTVVPLDSTPPGQALSTERACANLDPRAETLVTACDHEIVIDRTRWERFRVSPDCDAAVFTVRGYPGAARRPEAYSYVLVDNGDAHEFPLARGVSLKKPVPGGDDLLVGTFWFRTGGLLRDGIAWLRETNERVNGELYLDGIIAALARHGFRTRVIRLDGYVNWGDPDSFAEAAYWEEVFRGPRTHPRRKYPGLSP